MAPRGRLAVIHNRPPWASMIDRQIASPIPMPCALVVNSGSNMRSIALGLNSYPMGLQVVAHEGQSFPDKIVDIERSPGPRIPLEERPNILDHRARTVPVGHDCL